MKWVERAALSRQICPSAAPRCCQGWLSLGEIKWRSTKASRGRGARMIDLGTQTCNLDAIFGLLHQLPPDRRMASALARAPNIGAPHHRSQPHHRDRCRRYRPSATLSRSADYYRSRRSRSTQEKKRGVLSLKAASTSTAVLVNFNTNHRDIVSTQTDLTSTQTDLVSTQTDLASTQTDVDGIHGQIHALLQYAF